jgi:uncharacterized membrane protein
VNPRNSIFALAVASVLAAAPVVTSAAPARPAATAPVKAETERAAPATEADAERYAEREQKADEQKEFKGGAEGYVYIGGTTLAVALAIVLIILLV